MGHPIMSTRQILFLLFLLAIVLIAYQYFYEGQGLIIPGFNKGGTQDKTPLESSYIQQPKVENESALVGEISLVRAKSNSVTVLLDAKSKIGEVVEMMVWTDRNKKADWEEYNKAFTVETDAETNVVYVKFRDDKNYESIDYSVSVK